MPLFTPTLYLKKPTETEQVVPNDYNDNLDAIDKAVESHLQDNTAHGLGALSLELSRHAADLALHDEAMSLYKLNKDSFGLFTELQWKRADGTLAKKSVLSNGVPPNYTTKTVTYFENDGTTVKAGKVYTLSYDQENDLISEVLQEL